MRSQGTKLGDHQEGQERQVLPADQCASRGIKDQAILVVLAPNALKEMVGDSKQGHELRMAHLYWCSLK